MPMKPRSLRRACVPALALLLLVGLGGCQVEGPLREVRAISPSHRAAAEPAPQSQKRGESRRAAELVATGGQTYDGAIRPHCVLHDERGVQLNLRTEDSELPTVALRLDEYRGSGDYRAQLFVTGRSATGALVGSTGGASVELRGAQATGAGAPIFLSGAFEGSYAGAAGRGTVRGRFARCAYRPIRGGIPLLADGQLGN